jgi:hypothetical protein
VIRAFELEVELQLKYFQLQMGSYQIFFSVASEVATDFFSFKPLNLFYDHANGGLEHRLQLRLNDAILVRTNQSRADVGGVLHSKIQHANEMHYNACFDIAFPWI